MKAAGPGSLQGREHHARPGAACSPGPGAATSGKAFGRWLAARGQKAVNRPVPGEGRLTAREALIAAEALPARPARRDRVHEAPDHADAGVRRCRPAAGKAGTVTTGRLR